MLGEKNKSFRCHFCEREIAVPDNVDLEEAIRTYIIPEDKSHGKVDLTVCGCQECAAFFDKVYCMLEPKNKEV